ncbi:MAG TPA: hypothetical protein VNM67_05455 [Thermoanaerobaculia bacterium]|jgi:hypothetical protein|nr:hypothetical protein [Thermoanaerobaculia bacterium]
MKTYTDDDLVLFFYGEHADPVAMREALAADPELRARFEALESVLAAVDLPVPERPEAYGARVWARLLPRLGPKLERKSFWSSVFAPRLAWAAAALLLVIGFAAGRYFPWGPQPQVAQTLPEQARDRILAGAVAGHLESSERLLVEVANANPGEGGEDLDLSAERAWAQDLLEANRLYRQSARHGGRKRLATLLDELEPFLLELAHATDESSPEEMQTLRDRIDEQALLFKVRILGERLEQSARQDRTGKEKT